MARADPEGTGAKVFGEFGPYVLRPEEGEIVFEPERPGQGYWVGAPSVLWDAAAGCWWLTYRRRRPRGVNPDGRGERGYLAGVARSDDGLRFEDVWGIGQQALQTASMERFSLARDGDSYCLYISYVDPADSRWRIDLLEANHPSRFDSGLRRPALTASDASDVGGEAVEGVKDPWVFRVGATWHMLVSYAARRTVAADQKERLHETADVYTTGLITAPTALAVSPDGRRWQWVGRVLDTGGPGTWDGYQARLNSLLPLAGGWLGFYDGSASEQENYEERCGLALSPDLRHWTRLTPREPALLAPHGTGSVRYVEAVLRGGDVHLYYEYARPDGAHDLRRLVLRHDVFYSNRRIY